MAFLGEAFASRPETQKGRLGEHVVLGNVWFDGLSWCVAVLQAGHEHTNMGFAGSQGENGS